ncbi:hypothetical protein PHLCEN_2v5181 [Hermanssonia centrifuga]|uniref:Uncharacterized protein n=1 Tax=Hermanssonia centrifuga TaxID=98765 RepID=A0A2R6P8S1_9APHY|nr:hypothetical protein PHLCEN_2v5181 [Hermanssonia centrifuga]
MAEMFPGAALATIAPPGQYGRLDSSGDRTEETGVGEGERIRGGDGGVVGTSDGALGRTSESGRWEDDGLMNNGSTVDISPMLDPPPRSPRSPERPRAGSGPDPAAWLGGREIDYTDPVVPVTTSRDRVSPTTPPLPSSGFGMSSSEGHSGDSGIAPVAGTRSEMEHLMPSPVVSASGVLYGSGGSNSGSRSSVHGYALGSGPGSSAHGHGSSSGHGGPASSLDHGAQSSSSHHMYSVPLSAEGRRSPGPSSLLPTHSNAPPTAYRGVDNTSDEEKPKRRTSFLGSPLKWVKNSRPSTASSTSSATPVASASNRHRSGSTTSQAFISPTPSFYGTPKISSPKLASIAMPPAPILIRQPASSASLASTMRPQSPTLASLPAVAFAPYGTIPENSVPQSMPVWPGLGPLVGGPMPSPALTEHSGHQAPEGLLDPTLGMRLGAIGMASTAAISFRDDMDYSRPIGGLDSDILPPPLARKQQDVQLDNNTDYGYSGIFDPSESLLARFSPIVHSGEFFFTAHIMI